MVSLVRNILNLHKSNGRMDKTEETKTKTKKKKKHLNAMCVVLVYDSCKNLCSSNKIFNLLCDFSESFII